MSRLGSPPGLRHSSRQQGFLRDQEGASALEFAIIAFPLILLLLGVLEIGVVYFANFSLEYAVGEGARLVRTGQAQANGFDAAGFKNEVCKRIYPPLTCGNLKLDVRHYTSFGGTGGAAGNLTNPFDANGNLKENYGYDPGTGGDIVVVRGFYELDIVGLMPREIRLDNMNNGNRVLMATAAFRNEPFNQEEEQEEQ